MANVTGNGENESAFFKDDMMKMRNNMGGNIIFYILYQHPLKIILTKISGAVLWKCMAIDILIRAL